MTLLLLVVIVASSGQVAQAQPATGPMETDRPVPIDPVSLISPTSEVNAGSVEDDVTALASWFLKTRVQKQAVSFDSSVEPGTAGATIGRTDFWQAIGLFVGPGLTTSDEDGVLKVAGSPHPRVNLSLALTPPVLRDGVTAAFDEAAEETALSGLDEFDNRIFEAKIRVWPPEPKGSAARAFSRYVIARMGGTPEIDRRFRESEAELMGDSDYARLFDRYQGICNAWKAEPTPELLAQCRTAGSEFIDHRKQLSFKSVTSAYLNELRNSELDPLYVAYRNRLQVQLGLSARGVNELIGQEERGLHLTAQWGSPRLPRKLSVDETQQWLSRNRRALGFPSGSDVAIDEPKIDMARLNAYALDLSYVEKREIIDAVNPALNLSEYRDLKASFQWKKKFFMEKSRIEGPLILDHSLTVSFARPNEDFVNERFVANETLTFYLTDTVSVPVSLSWANKQEFLEEDDVSGHIGLSFSLRRKGETSN